jgi:hypothetical protein
MPRFQDIPKFYNPNSGVDYEWAYLEAYIEDQQTIGLDINPDFQRGHVWDEDRQIAYIENRLQDGLAGRVIYINRGPWLWRSKASGLLHRTTLSHQNEHLASWQGCYQYVLVDGLQRLTAILKFLRNELPIFGGYYRADWSDRLPHQASIRIAYGEFEQRKDILNWYLQLNSGGVVHTQEELDRVRALLAEEQSSNAG